MTDRFALDEHHRLFDAYRADMRHWPITNFIAKSSKLAH